MEQQPIVTIDRNTKVLSINATYHKILPHKLHIVLDLSGSMSELIKKNYNDEEIIINKINGTILMLLSNYYYMNYAEVDIYVYNTSLNLLTTLTKFNEQEFNQFKNILKSINPDNSTYINKSIKKLLTMIDNINYTNTVFLFTDGCDTEARTEDSAINAFNLINNTNIVINTFLIGTNGVYPKYLQHISNTSFGTYSYIDDIHLAMSIFNRALNYDRTKVISNSSVIINYKQTIFDVNCESKNIYQTVINVGKIHTNNTKYIDLSNINFDNVNSVVFQYLDLSMNEHFIVPIDNEIDIYFSTISKINNCLQQYNTINTLKTINKNEIVDISNNIIVVLESLKNTDEITQNKINCIINQIQSEIIYGLDNYKEWGIPYFYYILSSLKNNETCCKLDCINDTPEFILNSDESYILSNEHFIIDKEFIIQRTPIATAVSYTSSSAYVPNQVSLSTFASNSGCVHENCKIQTKRGFIEMKNLTINDEILTVNIYNNNTSYNKLCKILKFKNNTPLIKINNLIITSYHPILYDNEWIFPINVTHKNIVDYGQNYVYSLITENSNNFQSYIVENIQCIGLNHGCTDNDVLNHPFFGSNKVVQCFDKFPAINGIVELNDIKTIRNNITGMIEDYQS